MTRDIDFTQAEQETSYREELEQFAKEKGAEYLHEKLREVDSKSAENIHANNVKRVIRALEFYHQNGTPISEHNEEQKQQTSPYNLAYFVLTAPREILYERIDRRVDQMMEEGLLEEVKSLRERGCHRGMVSIQGLATKRSLPIWKENILLKKQCVSSKEIRDILQNASSPGFGENRM